MYTMGQFHQHFRRAFFVWKLVQSQTLNREKLLKRLWKEKCLRKMLMKLTPCQYCNVKIVYVFKHREVFLLTTTKTTHHFDFAFWMILSHFMVGHFGWTLRFVFGQTNFSPTFNAAWTLNHSCMGSIFKCQLL